MTNDAYDALLQAFRDASRKVADAETRARSWLDEGGDPAGYARILLDKVAALKALPEAVRPHLAAAPAQAREHARAAAENLAARADAAKRSGSSFWMSALLYPEDWRKGDPSDLDDIIEELTDLRP